MTTPNVPYRIEVDLVIPATPTEVWAAITTAEGSSAWMMPTTGTAEVGGQLIFHMGPDADSKARVTAVEPERRFVYEEDWADLAMQPDAIVTPLVTEFLIEARSGGTCAVKIVTSAFGVGADWENEFFTDMSAGWVPMLDNLRLYLTNFPGQPATSMWISATFSVGQPEAIAAVRDVLGFSDAGDPFSARDVHGVVERSLDRHFFLQLDEPLPGYVSFFAYPSAEGAGVAMQGYFFSSEAPGYVEREQPAWQAWLDDVAARTGAATR